MRLVIDTKGKQFLVTRAADEKRDINGRQRMDKRTQEPLFTVQVTALDETGAEVLNVTVAGLPPKVAVGQYVSLVELEAIPWAQDGRNGVAFRAKEINPAAQPKAA
jgi:hypothetical protein